MVKARMVVEAANIPVSVDAETFLGQRGVLVIPDFIANAGGVIAGAVELRKGTPEESLSVAGLQIRGNVQAVLEESRSEGILPRQAAENMARRRVLAAMKDKGWL
jgi:glutamate dehydrogenase/leucine dehydrogenase